MRQSGAAIADELVDRHQPLIIISWGKGKGGGRGGGTVTLDFERRMATSVKATP